MEFSKFILSPKNRKNHNRLIFAATIFLTIVTHSVYGFRAIENDTFKIQESQNIQNDFVQREPTARQLELAELLIERSAFIKWNKQTGTPKQIKLTDKKNNLLNIELNGEHKRFYRSVRRARRQQIKSKKMEVQAKDAVRVLANMAGLYGIQNANNECDVYKITKDKRGHTHMRVKQKWEEMDVPGCELVVHFDDKGRAYEINGRFYPLLSNKNIISSKKISKEQAKDVAQNSLTGLGYPLGKISEEPKLVLHTLGSSPRLAYELILRYEADSEGNPGAWKYYVDASTREVISGNNWFIFNSSKSGNPDSSTFAHRTTGDWGTTDPVVISTAASIDIVQKYFLDHHARLSYDTGGVHANSSVQNLFFNLLTDGDTGHNDGTDYAVPGIGFEKAAQLAYRTLVNFATPNTDSEEIVDHWVSAAGEDEELIFSIKSAWHAVGVLSEKPEKNTVFSIEQVVIQDKSYGDGDGNAEPGESIKLKLQLKNVTDRTFTSVSVKLLNNDPQISISTSKAFYSYIAPGQTAFNFRAFHIWIDDNAEEKEYPIQVVLNHSRGSWTNKINLTIEKKYTIRGRVFKAGSENGIPNVPINYLNTSGDIRGRVVADSEGFYSIKNLKESKYLINPVHDSYVPVQNYKIDLQDSDFEKDHIVDLEMGSLSMSVDPKEVNINLTERDKLETEIEILNDGDITLNYQLYLEFGGDPDHWRIIGFKSAKIEPGQNKIIIVQGLRLIPGTYQDILKIEYKVDGFLGNIAPRQIDVPITINVKKFRVESEIYVDPEAEGIMDGSYENPYNKIATAIDLAKPGYEIFLFDGVYREEVVITKNNLQMSGLFSGNRSAVITRGESPSSYTTGVSIKNATGITLRNISISNHFTGVHLQNTSNTTLEHLKLTDDSHYSRGIYLANANHNLIVVSDIGPPDFVPS